jgi:nucleotide-binding universal stress UspA family protein
MGIMSHATTTKGILVATDFSDGSDEALAQAIDLGGRLNATLDLVHVLEFGAGEFPFGLISGGDSGGMLAYADRQLSLRAARAAASGVGCLTHRIEASSVAQEIIRFARVHQVELIVMGTHGRRGLAHAMLGSVAEQVVRGASCPVLTVPFARKAA